MVSYLREILIHLSIHLAVSDREERIDRYSDQESNSSIVFFGSVQPIFDFYSELGYWTACIVPSRGLHLFLAFVIQPSKSMLSRRPHNMHISSSDTLKGYVVVALYYTFDFVILI